MQNEKSIPRKKFLLGGLGVIALLAGIKTVFTKKKKNTVKMLTEDGKLVEVDADLISGKGTRITDRDIHTWVKNKKAL